MAVFGFHKQTALRLQGSELVSDFVSAMTNLTTVHNARSIAEQTEQHALQTVSYAGNSLQAAAQMQSPSGLTPDLQAEMVRSSVDAHVQKVQAEQITAYTEQQLTEMETADKQKYIGKKIKITILDPKFQPVETFWLNNRTGQYDRGYIKFKTVSGIITDMSLRENRIMIKSTRSGQLFMPARKFMVVYIVNPQTLTPAVSVSF